MAGPNKFTIEDAPKSQFTIGDDGPDISSEASMATHPPAVPKPMAMQPSYSALAIRNSPTGADPHNPGNPNLNAVPASELGKVNDRALETQMASIGGAPLAEAAVAGSVKPLIPLARSVVGSAAGGYLGREAGSLVGHPEAGKVIGGLAGGLYGGIGGKVPTKEGLANLFEEQAPQPKLGGPLPSYEDYALNRGTEITRAMKQQPEAFGLSKIEPEAELGSPDNPAFHSKLPARLPPNLRGDPFAPTPKIAGPINTGAKTGVAVLPEPRASFEGENEGYMASTPRAQLSKLAVSGKPGAGTQMQQLGHRVLYIPKGADIESPSIEGLRQPEAEPRWAYRAHDEGNPDFDLSRNSPHATLSPEEAAEYRESRGNQEGAKPQTVSRTNLNLVPDQFEELQGPRGNPWIKFRQQQKWEPYKP